MDARLLIASALLVACGARSELEQLDPFDASVSSLDASRGDRVAVDRLLVRPEVSLRSCDGSPLPRVGAVNLSRTTGRFRMNAVFDPASRRVLQLGGYRVHGMGTLGPTSLDVDTGAATMLRLEGATALPLGSAAVWDARRSRAILVGGSYREGGPRVPRPQVLEVRVEGSVARVRNLADLPTGTNDRIAVAIDPERDELIATGGNGAEVSPAWGETWALPLAPTDASWQLRVSAERGPPASNSRSMGWDPQRRRMVLAGGRRDGTPDRRAWVLEADRWREVPGVLDAVPAHVTGLRWDERACGFVMSVGACSTELWLLRVGDRAEMALLGQLPNARFENGEQFRGSTEPSIFLDGDQLLFIGGDNCENGGATPDGFARVALSR